MVTQAEELRYGGDEAFAPFESLGADGSPRGFQIDLLAAMAPLLGAKVRVQLQPWERTERSFRERQLDFVAMVDTDSRRQWALFARGHATPALALYHRRDRAALQNLQDLADLRLSVLDGEPMRETLSKWLPVLRGPIVAQADAAGALDAVATGRVDVAVLPRAYAEQALAGRGDGVLTASALLLRVQSYAFAVAPGNDALRDRLQRAVDQLEANGRLEALRIQWLGSHREVAERKQLERRVSTQREWMLGAGGAAALALLGLTWLLRRRSRSVAVETARRRDAEASLQRAQELLGRSFTHNGVPMLVVASQGGMVSDANEAMVALLGVQQDALLGRPLRAQQEHFDPAALEHLAHMLDIEGALAAVPLRVRRADGASRDCLVSADRMALDGSSQLFCVLQDITPQLEANAALKREYDALAKELVAARDELQQFTRAVSHDLKAPVRAVQGFAGLLRDRLRAGHTDEAAKYTEHIDRATVRMSTMIDALSRLAQMGQRPLSRQAVDMKRLAEHAWSFLSAAQPQRRVAWRVTELPPAQADGDLVAQVWQNLLDNAWKYTARRSDAAVSVGHRADDAGRTWYTVADNGAGFDMTRAEGLFQPFRRMHTNEQFVGTGVGLSLVRRIVDLHGGEITLRSAPGVGTVVEFTVTPAR
jgi:PAS domain S-box-containing protein